MSRRKVEEGEVTAEGQEQAEAQAEQAAEPQEVQPEESVRAKVRLVWLGGLPGDDTITPRLVVTGTRGIVGEINLVVTGAKARRMFESGSGVFELEIRPA